MLVKYFLVVTFKVSLKLSDVDWPALHHMPEVVFRTMKIERREYPKQHGRVGYYVCHQKEKSYTT